MPRISEVLQRPLRAPADQLQLVTAVHESPVGEPETDTVEWKLLDLNTKEGGFAIARTILALANRHPEDATRTADGLGYVVVGAEPGKIQGVGDPDFADLDKRMDRYLGPFRGWSPALVRHDLGNVLVVTVEAPRWGDPIHTLRRAFQGEAGGPSGRDGDVFVRRHGHSVPASSNDIEMLTERARAQKTRVGLEVEVSQSEPIPVVNVDPKVAALWLEVARSELLRRVTGRSDTDTEEPNADGAARTVAQFRDEVGAYIDAAREVVTDAALDGVASAGAEIQVTPSNPTEGHLVDVRLELSFETKVWLFEPGRLKFDRVLMPGRPAAWRQPASVHPRLSPFAAMARDLGGLSSLRGYDHGLSLGAFRSTPNQKWVTCNNETRTVRWADFELRTRYLFPLKKFRVIAAGPVPEVRGQWIATAAGLSGMAHGEFSLHVAGDMLSIDAALAKGNDDD